tara:strand:- start:2155 stop:2559 length:405 start_codon:yes stop_codon:yes gene_type:complete
MSFSRITYDKCAFKKSLLQSESPGNYMLFPGKYYSNNQCRVDKGIVGGNQVSLSKNNLVDLESDLRGQTRMLSDCPSEKFQPRCERCRNCIQGLPCGCIECQDELINLKTCSMFNYNDIALPDKLPNYGCAQPY